jgi:hypothetical protein
MRFPTLFASFVLILFLAGLSAPTCQETKPSPFYDQRGFMLDGRYILLRGGTIQWSRLPESAWEDRIKRFKAAGFNTIDMYVAWNDFEPAEGVFNFRQPDIRAFLDLVHKHGLYVYFRPGPYICNEYDGGGLPRWMFAKTSKKTKDADGRLNLRTDDPDYLATVKRYFHELNQVITPYLISNGGPILLYSVENEYNWYEIFHEADKLFWYDGGPERAPEQLPGTANYLATLRDILRADGIDIPITTCPGDGQVSGMANVAGIIPMPNFYQADEIEKKAYDLVTSMHDSYRFGGNYVDYPTGTTETDRQASRMKRLIMGGLDAFFAFNIAGFHQEGYQNALVMSAVDLHSFVDVTPEKFRELFFSPTVGYFHSVVDYYGAISSSGTLREKFYHFRRANLFLNDFENRIGGVLYPERSGLALDSSRERVHISAAEVGAAEEGGRRVHYWLDAGQGNYFIQLLNETGHEIVLPLGSIRVDGLSLPQYEPLTLPVEYYPGKVSATSQGVNSSDQINELHYSMIMLTNLPLLANLTMNYSSSEILTWRDFSPGKLLVLYGPAGAAGETVLSGDLTSATLLWRDESIQIAESSDSKLALRYRYTPFALLKLQTMAGDTLQVLITTIEEAGKFWFFNHAGHDYLVTSFDYLDLSATASGNGEPGIGYEFRAGSTQFRTLSASPFTIPEFTKISPYDPATGVTRYQLPRYEDPPVLAPTLLQTGQAMSDTAEIGPSYDDRNWRHFQGEPQYLERNGIYTGPAWYRTTFSLATVPSPAGLYIQHAADIIGIYVNGRYLTTVSPMGTEIDNLSRTPAYQFADLAPYLKPGQNSLAFRTEIWGHGSFMWPRGNLDGTDLQIPALGFDSLKGLGGAARLAGQNLTEWRLRAGFSGQNQGYFREDYDDSNWSSARLPLQLTRGDIRWYRTKFQTKEIQRDNLAAPVVLQLQGQNCKATIYLNGHLIGRWLSDEAWLAHGGYIRPLLWMWSVLNPNHFPLATSRLKPSGEENTLAVVFEDTSIDAEQPGQVEAMSIIYNEEEKATRDDATILVPNIRNQGVFSILGDQ